MAARSFEDILDECMERLRRGESVEACLTSYPEHATELEPLLRMTARLARGIPAPPEDRKRVARLRFQGAVRAHLREKERSRFSWGSWPAWGRTAASMAAAVALFVGVGGGTVWASGSAMPDSPLYGVKRSVERVQMALAVSEDGRAQLHMELADRRAQELAAMAEKGRTDEAEALSREMVRQLELARAESGVSLAGGQSYGIGAAEAAHEMEVADAPADSDMDVAMDAPSEPAPEADPVGLPRPIGSDDGSPWILEVAAQRDIAHAYLQGIYAREVRYAALLEILGRHTPQPAREDMSRAVAASYGPDETGEFPGAVRAEALERLLLVQGELVRDSDGTLRVAGLSLRQAPSSLTSGEPSSGDRVTVGGVMEEQDTLTVVYTEVVNGKEHAMQDVRIQGRARQLNDDRLMVGPYEIAMDRAEIQGRPAVGQWVLVAGEAVSDRQVVAREVRFLDVDSPVSFAMLDR